MGQPGYIGQLVMHLTQEQEIMGSMLGSATYFHFSFHWYKKGSCQLAKVSARSTVNYIGSVSLTKKSVVRLTDRHNMTLDVYRERKSTTRLLLWEWIQIQEK